MPELSRLPFDDRFVRSLPGDSSEDNVPRPVADACWSPVRPTPVSSPRTLAVSVEVADLLGMPRELLDSQHFAEVFSGNRLIEGMRPFAACYGGHQFGNWAGQLGDGRAMSLGELVDDSGEHWELQLKGAGPTPYSRTGDGRAVLRSSIREFLCSEAMHHLGVPTTRALSLVATGDRVWRDMFYDGRPEQEPGAVVCRVAPTFLRFGSLQIHALHRQPDVLRELLGYILEHYASDAGPLTTDRALAWLREVAAATARTVVEWMRVGFVHGVMNTDNMSILGLTIDYGPYGWVDDFDPEWTPNTSDSEQRRYRFGHQPAVAHWNVMRLAEALHPVVPEPKALEAAANHYVDVFHEEHGRMMQAKLGLQESREGDGDLIEALVALMRRHETDMTLFWRGLSTLDLDPEADDAALLTGVRSALYQPELLDGELARAWLGWLRPYASRARSEGKAAEERRAAMDAVNPRYVLRNYLSQQVIDQATAGDPSGITELLDVMRRPYDDQPGRERFAEKRPEWARNKPGCSMLSCSS
jgi:uncharacterized protein YdiU (UPF0061 family)